MNSFNQWIHIDINTQKKNLPLIDPFDFILLASWKVTLIYPTKSGPKWLSLIFLVTFLWEQMKAQLLLRLQVTALSTQCQINLHPSMAWGDFIKANSFASASSISNSWSGLWNRIGSNWYIVPAYEKCCCVELIGILDDGPQAADDTSINWLPSLTVNLEVQHLNDQKGEVDYTSN